MRRPWGWLCLLALFASPLMAQDVPPALKDWQDWVLHNEPQHACPVLVASTGTTLQRQCAWPGRLALDAGKDGARFALDVHVDGRSWVALPGNARDWPQQVTANAKPVAVLDHEGEPSLLLEAGDYALRGNLAWDSRPASVHVPASIGLVALTLDGKAVAHIERNGEDLTLGEAAATQRAADALSLRVFRRLVDGLPADLLTQMQFNVTGTSREQLLGPVLPKGFVATFIEGSLPARLESDGRLRVQLRPGQWTITLGARSTDVPKQIALTPPGEPWPAQEIWSYADDPSLRSTRVEGQPADAGQADVPHEWAELPAYALDAGHGLTIEQGTRGGEGGQGDQLTLRRHLWLDFDGHGFTAADTLTGTLRRSQRLDVVAPWQLQNASQSGRPLLVTEGEHGRSGVELRDAQLNLKAGLRLPERGSTPTGGWQLPLESIDAELHLPYGYRLIGAAGADRSPDSWIAQWSLLDLFVVALIALLAGRLLGWPWAIVALGFLVLAQHEDGAPRWTLAVAFALALLMRALPEGRLRLASRLGAAALLLLSVLWSLPFASTQMEYALHPQLEEGHFREGIGDENYVPASPQPVAMVEAPSTHAAPAQDAMAPEAAPAPPAPPLMQANGSIMAGISYRSNTKAKSPPQRQLSSVVVTGTAYTVGQEPDTRNIIQAGPGTPHWDVGNDYRLGWSGPITAEQTTRLVIAPAWLVRLLRVAMLALLVAMLGKLATRLWPAFQGQWRGMRLKGGAAALLVLALMPHGAQAQAVPTDSVLEQLHGRLIEAPKCAPDCATVAQATFQAVGDQLSVDMDIHAGTDVAVPLPQGDAALSLQSVSSDGKDVALSRVAGDLLVKLDRGVHRVTLHYGVTSADTATLHFPLRPQHAVFTGSGWKADGVAEGRLLGDSVTFNRVRLADDGSALATASQAFPPYVRLTRTLVLGSEWTVRNTVQRIAPSDAGFSLDLPLLPGEHPLGDDARVQDGRIGVTFNAGEVEKTWLSRLDRSNTLTLSAPGLGERAETWIVQSATLWHLDTRGVPSTQDLDGLQFQPLPGETLHIAVTQPKAITGESLAFDRVVVESRAGDRTTETTLTLKARSTRGGEHAIGLPKGAELLEAKRDGVPLSLAIRDDKLSLPLLPGAHEYTLRLREPMGVAFATRTPEFSLNAPVANIQLHHVLPESRWVLWTWGPSVGPAVLYWAQLLVLLIAAWLLARYAPTPLRFHQWLLLGLGFSAFAWGAYALVVIWLILLGLRARHVLPERYGASFNLAQVALAIVTGIAIVVLISAVPKGLLGLPDMHVDGYQSTAWQLNWFADKTDSALPQGGVFSVSVWVYKIAMLLWALWLANALIGWLRWGFEAWSTGGYWRKRQPKAIEPPPIPEVTE
ncbi:hypothetical protein [Dyella sp. C11]|uniref:hypothetical protein n=1 Tax=Dyella sp. C11 TaxID=2126991 RepID=UPI000D642761|nr:hypothetical protein [Dyella sp. C11]